MTGPLAMVVSVVLVVVAAMATAALLRTEGRVDAVITSSVVAAALVVGSMLGLGVVGLLRPGPLLVLQGIEVFVPLVLLARRGGLRVDLHSWRPTSWRPSRSWESALVGLAVLALGWQLVVALVLPPFAYDALAYHLVDVATWVQDGRLSVAPLNPCCGFYPSNAELLSTWPAVLLHSDRLVGTVQIAAALLGGGAVVGLCRTAGVDRRGAGAAGALFVLTPALLAQAPTSYVDVLQTVVFLCGLHGLTQYAASAGNRCLVVPALCAGMLTGTKGNGLLWAAGLGLAFVVVGLVHLRRGRVSRPQVVLGLLGGLAACALLGGWWYVRNALETGNPLYPFALRLGGRVLLPGPFQVDEVLTPPTRAAGRPWPLPVLASWAADLLPWRHGFYDYQQRVGGLGPVWSWLGVLTVPVLVHLWRRRSVALAAVAVVLVVLLVQPYAWWARFTLPVAALGAVAVVVAAQWLRPGLLRRLFQTGVLLLALTGALLVVGKVVPASEARPLPAWRVLELAAGPSSERSVQHLFFPEYRFLDQVALDATVLVDLEAPDVRFVYPLYGSHFTRRVLPAGPGPLPASAWVVTSPGRPLDRQLSATRPGPFSDERGVRVWAPLR